MFIWTISDLFGLVILALFILFFGGMFLVICIQDWFLKRRRKKASTLTRPPRETPNGKAQT